MNADIHPKFSFPAKRCECVFEKIKKHTCDLTKNLFASSSPMTITDKIGLLITLIFFSFIISPIATSDSDPYQIKWIFEVINNQVSLIEKSIGNHDNTQYTLIVHLKSSSEFHLDATEKVILGKYRAITN